jgi:uncharacterized protein YggU (UPF0235/DUF167 family)
MLIKVKVFLNSKKEEIVKKSDDAFEIFVKEKPLEGRINRAMVKALALYFKISE